MKTGRYFPFEIIMALSASIEYPFYGSTAIIIVLLFQGGDRSDSDV